MNDTIGERLRELHLLCKEVVVYQAEGATGIIAFVKFGVSYEGVHGELLSATGAALESIRFQLSENS